MQSRRVVQSGSIGRRIGRGVESRMRRAAGVRVVEESRGGKELNE